MWKKCFPILHCICILWREYHTSTINNLTINSGTLRLINFSNSSQWSGQSKALLASKNVTNTLVDRFLYNSMYSLFAYSIFMFANDINNGVYFRTSTNYLLTRVGVKYSTCTWYLYLSTYLSVLDVLEYLVYGNVKVLVLVLVLDQKVLGTYK